MPTAPKSPLARIWTLKPSWHATPGGPERQPLAVRTRKAYLAR